MRGYVIGGIGTVVFGFIAVYGFTGGVIPSVAVSATFTALTTISAIATIVDYNNTKVSNG
jgi:hypothetical protein